MCRSAGAFVDSQQIRWPRCWPRARTTTERPTIALLDGITSALPRVGSDEPARADSIVQSARKWRNGGLAGSIRCALTLKFCPRENCDRDLFLIRANRTNLATRAFATCEVHDGRQDDTRIQGSALKGAKSLPAPPGATSRRHPIEALFDRMPAACLIFRSGSKTAAGQAAMAADCAISVMRESMLRVDDATVSMAWEI